MMKHKKLLALLMAFAVVGQARSNIIERPFFHQFKGQESLVIRGYIQFGEFPNGAKAITKVGETRALFYQRDVLVKSFIGSYMALEIDCKMGVVYAVGIGELERITAITKEISNKVQDYHPDNLPTYRRICESVGLTPGKW